MNKRGIEIVKEREGLYLESYLCPAGRWTIGYGTTVIKGIPVPQGLIITKEQAEEYLRADLEEFEKEVLKLVKVPLNENQLSALVSFTYNVGIGNFKRSTLLMKLNKKHYKEAGEELLRWNKANVKGKMTELPGLTKRRKLEKELYETQPTQSSNQSA